MNKKKKWKKKNECTFFEDVTMKYSGYNLFDQIHHGHSYKNAMICQKILLRWDDLC